MRIAIALLALIAAPTFATNKPKPQEPVKDAPSQSQTQTTNIDTAARADAAARSSSRSTSASHSNSASQSSSDNAVAVEGDQNTYRSRAIAVSLPGLVAAPPVPGECLEHYAGYGAFSAGKTGYTRLNKACLEDQRCLALADRFALWGYFDAAARQLATCGGVAPGEQSITVTDHAQQDSTNFATKDDIAAVNEKLDRMFRRGVGK